MIDEGVYSGGHRFHHARHGALEIVVMSRPFKQGWGGRYGTEFLPLPIEYKVCVFLYPSWLQSQGGLGEG
jgi:hypothetical protein